MLVLCISSMRIHILICVHLIFITWCEYWTFLLHYYLCKHNHFCNSCFVPIYAQERMSDPASTCSLVEPVGAAIRLEGTCSTSRLSLSSSSNGKYFSLFWCYWCTTNDIHDWILWLCFPHSLKFSSDLVELFFLLSASRCRCHIKAKTSSGHVSGKLCPIVQAQLGTGL